MKKIMSLFVCLLLTVPLLSQNVPHTVIFELSHKDGVMLHQPENLGVKVVNLNNSKKDDSISYNYPSSKASFDRAINYDAKSGQLLIQLSFLNRYLAGDSLKVDFCGDGDSRFEIIIIRSKSSVTRGGQIRFGVTEEENSFLGIKENPG